MALNQSTQLGLATASFGVLSFVLAILAELKKPPYGTAIRGRDVVVCRFPPDPTVALGAMSTLAAACTAAMGALAVFFPYGGRRVPRKALFAYTPLFVFFHVAIGTTVIDMEPLHRVSRSPPPAPPPPPPPPSTAPKSRPSQPSLEQIHPHTDTPPRSSPDPSLFWRESPPPPPSFRPLYLADEVEVVPESPETHSPRIPSFAEVVKRRPLKSCLRSASAPPAVLKTARRIRFAPSPSPTKAYGRRGTTVAGAGMTMWPTAAEAMHHVRNVHRDMGYACPTAKTGVLGGAAFLNLDAMLFWMVCLMLARNVREDYFADGGDGHGDAGGEGLEK
ncbi:hypothetical protein ACP70R_034226 [Stipagrostis hirtigluma subsp. patula]